MASLRRAPAKAGRLHHWGRAANRQPGKLAVPLALALTLLLAACQSLPEPPVTLATATPQRPFLVELINTVEARANAVAEFVRAHDGAQLNEGSQVRTRADSRVRLDFGNGTSVRLGPNTLMAVERLSGNSDDPVTRVRFPFGRLYLSLASGAFEAVTPIGVASVRGSHAEIHYSPGPDPDSINDDVLYIRCLHGTCVYANVVNLGSMQQLIVTGGGVNITGPAPLEAAAIAEFLGNSPESAGLVATLTAAAPTATSLPPTITPTPSRTPTITFTPLPSATPTATLVPTDTPLPPTATNTPEPTRRFVTQPPRPAPTRVPPTQPPTQPPTNTSAPPPPPPPPPTNPPPATNTVPPPPPTNPPPTFTLPPPSDTPVPTETQVLVEPTRTPLPTKTASPVP